MTVNQYTPLWRSHRRSPLASLYVVLRLILRPMSDFNLLRAHMRKLESAPKRKQSEKQKMGMHLGTCTSWTKHGYGFVQPDRPIPGIERDLFVGFRTLMRAGINKLERGDRVSFDIGRAKDGRPEATNIQIIEALAA
jgi:cold shock CspA family protein